MTPRDQLTADITIAVTDDGVRYLAQGSEARRRLLTEIEGVRMFYDNLTYNQLLHHESILIDGRWWLNKFDDDPDKHFTFHTPCVLPGVVTCIGGCPPSGNDYEAVVPGEPRQAAFDYEGGC